MAVTLNSLAQILFHDVDTGRTVTLQVEKQVKTDFIFKLPIDLLYGVSTTRDPDTGSPSVTVLTREEFKGKLSELDRRLTQAWNDTILRDILGSNTLTVSGGKGYIRRLLDLIYETRTGNINSNSFSTNDNNSQLRRDLTTETNNRINADDRERRERISADDTERNTRIQQDNQMKTGSTGSSSGWSSSYNLVRHETRLNSHDSQISNLQYYDMPVGSIVPVLSVNGYSSSYFSRCFTAMNGQYAYSVTYNELADALADSPLYSAEPQFVPETENLSNIHQYYQGLMASTFAGFDSTANTPTRTFMTLDDLAKFMGGNTSRAKLLNAMEQPYSIAYGGNTAPFKNMVKEYYALKYGNNTEHGYTQTISQHRGCEKVEILSSRDGYLKYRINNGPSKVIELGNIRTTRGYLQVISIMSGQIILDEFAYVRADNNVRGYRSSRMAESAVKERKEMDLFRAVELDEEVLATIYTNPASEFSMEVSAMPLDNQISTRAGRSVTLPNMNSSTGLFLGSGGGSPGSQLSWTIPNMTLGQWCWNVENGIKGGRAGTTGGWDNTAIGHYDTINLDKHSPYRLPGSTLGDTSRPVRLNANHQLYPDHMRCSWYIKVTRCN